MPTRVCALFSMLVVFAGGAAAQSTALLTGTVNDSSGAVLAGANVVCRNTETGQSSTTATNTEGLFRFPALPVGPYEVTVTKAGFERLERQGIVLLTGQTLDLTLTLTVGQVNQSVEVTSPIPVVQTATSEVQAVVDSRQMEDLPLNGRNTFDLAILTPGSVNTDASTVPGQADNTGLAVNGLRSTDNNWELDGASYVNRSYGSAPSLPNPDTLQEFSVKSSNFSAETSGGGAAVKLTTRSGTNQFHGTAFEFLRNDAMDARNFFAVAPQDYKQNQYGVTLGGPIRHDKLFFFASYQGTNKRGNPSPTSVTVPTAAQRTGDYSNTSTAIIDPATGAEFPGNIIPLSRQNPISLKLLQYMPLPNYGTNLLVAEFGGSMDDSQWLGKADYMLSANDHLMARYFRDDHTTANVGSLPAFSGENNWLNQTASVSETHTFGPSWVMTASYSLLYINRVNPPVSPVTMQQLGAQVTPATPDAAGKMINVTITGYAGFASSGGAQMQPVSHEVQVNFSHAAGRHFIRFGSGFQHTADYESGLNANDAGKWGFNAGQSGSSKIAHSGDAFASYLLGLTATFTQASNSPDRYLMTAFAPWIQDDFRVSRDLTLNLGLRWEPLLSPYDSLTAVPGFLPGVQSVVDPLAPRGVVFGGDSGIPRSIVKNYWGEFSPRFGFAWNIGGSEKTVLRGGYGIFRSGSQFDGLVRNISGSNPTSSASTSISQPADMANPYAGQPGGSPFPYTPPTSLAQVKFAANASLRLLDAAAHPGYTQSWNLTIERQIARGTSVSVGYIGNHSLGIMTRFEDNPAIYGPGATVANENSRRLYPGIGQLTLGSSVDYSHYNSLQAQVTRRMRQGLSVMASYTWSKSMDIDSSGTFGTALAQGPRNGLDLGMDYAPSDFDATHQFRVAALYDLPKLRGGAAFARALANGWQLNAMIVEHTGFPVTCRSGVDNSMSGIGDDNCDQISAQSGRPAGANPLQEFFNTAAFTTNAIGTFGDAGRNDLRRPGMINTNLSLFRSFHVTEKLQAEFRVEAFNALNHPNFRLFYSSGSYISTITLTSPTFGQITYADDPRLMQVALKLRF